MTTEENLPSEEIGEEVFQLSTLAYVYANSSSTAEEKLDDDCILLFADPQIDSSLNPSNLSYASRSFKKLQRNSGKPFDIDGLICKLLRVGEKGLVDTISVIELAELCDLVVKVILEQPSLIEIDPPVCILGDVHGQYPELLEIFDKCGWPPNTSYLLLGDYVDRGIFQLETVSLLLAYKYKFPDLFFVLRGNHEISNVNRIYGFDVECEKKYGNYGPALYEKFEMVFDALPPAALVGDKILCMHGGLSPRLQNLDQLRDIKRPNVVNYETLICDLLWSDPNKESRGVKWARSTRGVSYIFNEDVVYEMCQSLDIDLIVRAHQLVMDGFEFFANRKLVTVFSAPFYCNMYSNKAAVMRVDEDLKCSFEVFCPIFLQEETTKETLTIDSTSTSSLTSSSEAQDPSIVRQVRNNLVGKFKKNSSKSKSI